LVRLRETIQKRNEDLIQRSSHRYVEAEQSLSDGVPEVAVEGLEEALSLLKTVETGGDEWRSKVQKKLEEARTNLSNKQRAEEYVKQSNSAATAQQARVLLLQARDIYPSYPRLAEGIRLKEEQLLDQIQVAMRADLSRVEALLNERKFDEARRRAEKMLHRGGELDFISKETTFQEARQQAEALLDRINAAQWDEQRFQERIRSIEAALAIPDVRLASSLLEAIPPDQVGRSEVTPLRLRINQMSRDGQKWQNIQRAFEQGLYDQIADLVEALVDSPRYQDQAAALQTRAQIRLLAQEAGQCETKGELTQAREIYHRILEFREVLADDQPIIEQARQDLTRLDGAIAQGARYEKRLAEVKEMSIQLRWTQWLEKLKALERDAGEVMRSRLDKERSEGLAKWMADAVERVKEIQMRKDDGRWREAYTLLHPLYTEGVISDKHEDYQRVAYNYHRYEADLRKTSRDPQELEKCVGHLRSLLGFAVPPAIKEKEELTQAIRNWALRHAQFTAADSNPTNAVKALEQILDQNRYELKEDADIWGYLVYYALQARNFERAISAAGVIGFIPGQENLARAWHQVVNGIKAFSSGKSPADWAAGVSGIADARRMGVSNKLLVESLDKFAVQLADQLYAQVSSSAGDLTNESILSRVRIYALMLQLNPEDSRAKARIDELAGRLNQISRDVMDRFKRLGDNPLTPEQEVAQLEAMGGEMEALVNAAAQLSEQQGATTQQLRTTLDRVKDRKTNLQSYMRLSKDLEERYRESLSKSWDTAGLVSALTELQRAARQAEINRQSSEWDEKIRNLIDVIDRLESKLDQLEKSWISEAYADVLTQCDELDAALRSGQSTLSDRSLVIPTHRIDLYNEYEKSPLNSVAAVRAAAQANKRDMDQWNQWCDRYDNLDDRCVRAQEAVERKLKEHCLSEAKTLIDAHIQALTEIVEQVGRMPKEARSKTTKDLRDKYAAHRQGEDPQAVIEQQRQKRAEIEAQIAELEPLLRRLRLFASGNVNWGNEVGRTAFRKLADPIYQIDACNPDLKKWLDLYEKKTGRKYP
jgi:uncharacterized protein Yka (UPF0111/DUF47 family)